MIKNDVTGPFQTQAFNIGELLNNNRFRKRVFCLESEHRVSEFLRMFVEFPRGRLTDLDMVLRKSVVIPG